MITIYAEACALLKGHKGAWVGGRGDRIMAYLLPDYPVESVGLVWGKVKIEDERGYRKALVNRAITGNKVDLALLLLLRNLCTTTNTVILILWYNTTTTILLILWYTFTTPILFILLILTSTLLL